MLKDHVPDRFESILLERVALAEQKGDREVELSARRHFDDYQLRELLNANTNISPLLRQILLVVETSEKANDVIGELAARRFLGDYRRRLDEGLPDSSEHKNTQNYPHRPMFTSIVTQPLTTQEKEVFQVLQAHENDLVPFGEFGDNVTHWKSFDPSDANFRRALQVTTSRLRAKLAKFDPPIYLQNLRGQGYRLIATK